jgi:glyoxalase family protein
MATEISYSVPEGSLEFWIKRFNENNIKLVKSGRFGVLAPQDRMDWNWVIVPSAEDNRNARKRVALKRCSDKVFPSFFG